MTKLMKSQLLLAGLLLLTSCGRIGDVLDGLLLPEADAQTYVRPSKGRAITLLASTTMNGSTSASAVYDMSAFVSVQVLVSITAASSTVSTCAYGPVIYVRGGTDPATVASAGSFDYSVNTSVAFDNLIVGESVESSRTWSYFVTNLPPVANIAVQTDQPGGGNTSCTLAVTVVPLPYPIPDAANVQPGSPTCVAVSNGGGGGGGYYTKVFSTSNGNLPRRITIQNKGTATVACRMNGGNSGVQWLSPSTTSMSLAAGSVAYDGTGGIWTIEGVYADVNCTALTSSGTHYVCAMAY